MFAKYLFKKTLTITTLFTIATIGIATHANASTTKYGVTVTNCGFDYDAENFCTDSRLKKYSNIMKSRQANFDGNKILYIFESKDADIITANVEMNRMVMLDTSNKTVIPFRHAMGDAMDDFTGSLIKVNSKGDTLKYDFSKSSNKFCFTGNIYAYRDSYSYNSDTKEPYCFTYDSAEKDWSRNY